MPPDFLATARKQPAVEAITHRLNASGWSYLDDVAYVKRVNPCAFLQETSGVGGPFRNQYQSVICKVAILTNLRGP